MLGLELASSAASKGAELAAATVLSNMLPANILTYSSPMKSVQTSLASGKMIYNYPMLLSRNELFTKSKFRKAIITFQGIK